VLATVAPPVSETRGLIRASSRLVAGIGAFFLATATVGGLFYVQLPYRAAWITGTTIDEVTAAPTPNFRMGAIEWNVSRYAADPALQPFRAAFHTACAGKQGMAAALCVSDSMARQFPYGPPSAEFTDRSFDPIAHLARHSAGEPGHCMNRVAIMAAELLASGIPARVTQLLPIHGPGHNVVEVWDEPFGWVVVDPTYGTVLGDGQRPAGAVVLRVAPDHVPWHTLAAAPAPKGTTEDARRNGPDTRLYKGLLFYPEPWLYLRVGPRSAGWPFRGAFARLGTSPFDFGRVLLMRLGIVGSASLGLGFLLVALRTRRREAALP
jgi:transglutaminase superfamily protein